MTREETMSEGHWFGPRSDRSKGDGHPVMFGDPMPTIHFDPFPDGGGYPRRFVEWALREMNCPNPREVLHLCSGSMRTGVRVGIRHETRPDVVADCRSTPFPDESFRWIMADPPYAETYAENLYGVGAHYPRPGEIVREATRLLEPGGMFGLLHFIVPMVRRPLSIVRVYGVTTGSGYAIRAWTRGSGSRLPSQRGACPVGRAWTPSASRRHAAAPRHQRSRRSTVLAK